MPSMNLEFINQRCVWRPRTKVRDCRTIRTWYQVLVPGTCVQQVTHNSNHARTGTLALGQVLRHPSVVVGKLLLTTVCAIKESWSMIMFRLWAQNLASSHRFSPQKHVLGRTSREHLTELDLPSPSMYQVQVRCVESSKSSDVPCKLHVRL